MTSWGTHLGFEPAAGDRVGLLVSDLSLARAFFEGIPAARLLARTRLGCDERDLVEITPTDTQATSSFETLLRSLVADERLLRERVRRAVTRHTRAAATEGPLEAPEAVIAALVAAVAASDDPDASLAEVSAECERLAGATTLAFARRAATHDGRLLGGPPAMRAAWTEACLSLAAVARLGPLPAEMVADAFSTLAAVSGGEPLPRGLPSPLYGPEGGLAPKDRHMAIVDRADLESLVSRDARALAMAIVRFERSSRRASAADRLVAELGQLLRARGALVMFRETEPKARVLDELPPVRAITPSWLPEEWLEADVSRVAQALETGAATVPQVRLAVARGGDAALDALGAEMLRASAHPFASAAFAEILAKSVRPRDVMRLVTYFAVAPDPSVAARALAACAAPELPRVLAAWLEAMIPADGELAAGDDDPDTSSAARLSACIAALAPYPHLYRIVSPLLERVSQTPAPLVAS